MMVRFSGHILLFCFKFITCRPQGTQILSAKMFLYPYVLTYALGAQKNRLIETVLLSTHNICFG